MNSNTMTDIDVEDVDINLAIDASTSAASAAKQANRVEIVPVDDAHPFDLEAYISGYTGVHPFLSHTPYVGNDIYH